eukprot:6149763-Heterocapsa_arctica.AAC.1
MWIDCATGRRARATMKKSSVLPSPLLQVWPSGATISPPSWCSHPAAAMVLGSMFQSPANTQGVSSCMVNLPMHSRMSRLMPTRQMPSFM